MLYKLKSHTSKIIVSAFPYSRTLSKEQNNNIYNLNVLMYNITNSYKETNILYVDTNNFISNFTLTRDQMHLPKFYKKQLTKLIAYNIFDQITENVTCFNQLLYKGTKKYPNFQLNITEKPLK